MDLTLHELTDVYLLAQQRLADSDLDEQTIADTLEGLGGEVAEKLEACIAISRNLQAAADQIQMAEAKMAQRRKTLESRSEWLRGYVKANMERSGITKIECPYFRASIVKNPASVVVDAFSEVPKGYLRYPDPPPPSVDKKAVAEAWKRGEEVPGTHLEQGTRLDIK